MNIRSVFVLIACILGLRAAVAAEMRVEVVAHGLQYPWALAFLPEGGYLVTERPGRLRLVRADGSLAPPLAGVPAVAAAGQGGLLDLVLDSGFATNRTLYFCYAEPASEGRTNSTALARARLAAGGAGLQDVRVIFRQQPKVASSAHFGCRIVERRVGGKPDGSLFLTLGERFSRMQDAQSLDNHHGKIVRVNKDGSVPGDNPFTGRAGALPEIWSYGHRNPQGAALAPDGTFWMHEHGPQGGDEINRPQPGANYGWPLVSHGVHYGGAPVGEGLPARPGLEPPLKYWVPSIAPSGMAFLTSDRYGRAWQGNLFVGSLKFKRLHRLELSPQGEVLREHVLLREQDARIRDVRQGPDGLLYVLTDEADGRLLRLQPVL